jgi:hypothetical protein
MGIPHKTNLYTQQSYISTHLNHQGYRFPSHVQNVAAPASSIISAVFLPPSSIPPHPFSPITSSIHPILSLGLIIPSTSQSKLTFAISVLTSPGCRANTTVLSASLSPLRSPFRFLSISAARCLSPWLSAAFDAAYAPNPSSKALKLVVEPESEEINTSVLIWRGLEGPQVGDSGVVGEAGVSGEERERRCWAVRRGPMVFVCK